MAGNVRIDTIKLDALFESFDKSNRPGVAVGIAHQGRPVYRRAFGAANLESGVALTPQMRIRIGSTTKHFTCLGIMLLAEDGKLDPNASVRRYIPELGEWADPVTLSHLMSHTGGVRCSLDILTLTNAVMSRPLAHEEQVKLLAGLRSVNFKPGENWMYSNGGYVLLTEIIRRLSGQTYETFIQERILDPVGMFNSLARPVDTDCLLNSATSHVPNAQGGFDKGIFGPAIGGEGNIVSTVDDMLLWLRHMSDPRIGSAHTWKRMMTPARLTSGASTGYGLGLAMNVYRGLNTVEHGGVVIGGRCQMLKVLEPDLDVIMIANTSGIEDRALGLKIIDACVRDLPVEQEPVKPKPLRPGRYVSSASGRVLGVVEHEGGVAIDFFPAKFPLPPKPDGSYVLPLNLFTGVRLENAGDGLDAIEFEQTDHFAPAAAGDPGEFDAIAGSYRSEELAISATVHARPRAYLDIIGRYGRTEYSLEPVARGLWHLRASAGHVAGTLEERDGVLYLSSSRAPRMKLAPVSHGEEG